MEKQTAVEWLLEEFKNFATNANFDRNSFIIKIHKANMVDLINKAKAMEKSQIEASYIEGAEMAKKVFKEELQEFIVLPKDCIN
jgi:hypothetical protein